MKRLMSILLALTMVLGMSTSVFAATEISDESANRATEEERIVDQALRDFGYSKEILEEMPFETKASIKAAIDVNPNDVQYTEAILEIDILKEVEQLATLSDSELKQAGLSESEIVECHRKLNELRFKEVDYLVEKYGLDIAECEILKEAAKGKVKENCKEVQKEQLVTSSGTIAKADLKYGHTTKKIASTTSKPVNYNIIASFQWLDTYYNVFNEDKIAVTWGGNLNRADKVNVNRVRYLPSKEFDLATKHYSNYYQWHIEDTPNTGVKITTDQSKNYTKDGKQYSGIIKSGTFDFSIYQKKKQGLDTRVVSKYCHRTVAVTGLSITFSKNPVSISVGTAWDASPADSDTITY